MQKLLLVPAALFVIGAASAADLRDNVGVGLGTWLFKDHNGLVSQISAATTNGSFGNQTFAITSGTSDAKPYDGIVSNHKAVQEFVAGNMDALAHDMAAGAGESVDALAELMNVPEADRTTFGKTLQSNFTSIFSSPTVTNDEVVANLAQFAPKA